MWLLWPENLHYSRNLGAAEWATGDGSRASVTQDMAARNDSDIDLISQTDPA